MGTAAASLAPRDPWGRAAEVARCRAGALRLLALPFRRALVPDDDAVPALIAVWEYVVDEACCPTARLLEYPPPGDPLPGGELRAEHEALFVLPAARYVSPVDSCLRGGGRGGRRSRGRLRSKPWWAVRKRYAAFGFHRAGDRALEDDHLLVELDYLTALCDTEARRLADRDEAGAEALRREQLDFLDAHLLAWLPELRRRIDAAAELSFYPWLVRALEGYLQLERRHLADDDPQDA